MRLTKREKATILALIVAFVGFLGMQALHDYSQSQRDQLAAHERADLNATYGLHEPISLDAARDTVELSNGTAYAAGFTWSGELIVTIEDVAWYANDDLLLPTLDADREWVQQVKRDWFDRDESSYVVVHVTVNNVSAKPTNETQRGESWFNISFVNLVYDGIQCELIGFSGVPEDVAWDFGEGNCFDLSPGESDEYVLIYELERSFVPSASLYMYLGVAYVPDKYRIEIDDVTVIE